MVRGANAARIDTDMAPEGFAPPVFFLRVWLENSVPHLP